MKQKLKLCFAETLYKNIQINQINKVNFATTTNVCITNNGAGFMLELNTVYVYSAKGLCVHTRSSNPTLTKIMIDL